MQALMFKFGERRHDWRCCFCCHVRTGTIFLGVWHLLLHVMALSVITVVLRHPELGGEDHDGLVPAMMPTPPSESPKAMPSGGGNAGFSPSTSFVYPGSTVDRPYTFRRSLTFQDLNVGVVVTFCTFAITLLMVYGAIKGKPAYLMPFFCLQVFDFCIAGLSALSYLCYLPDMHRIVAENPTIPMQKSLLALSPQSLSLIVLLAFSCAMLIKAYFIGVVWSCYKYLTLRLVSAQRTIHLMDPEGLHALPQDNVLLMPDPHSTLLPDYETAVKKFPPPPPSYQAATAGLNMPPPPPPPPVLPQEPIPAPITPPPAHPAQSNP